jgi:hypothetical protein
MRSEGRTKAMTAALNLAIRLKDLGKLEEAVLIEREIVEKRKRISGVEHSHTITTMSNLAVRLFLLEWEVLCRGHSPSSLHGTS